MKTNPESLSLCTLAILTSDFLSLPLSFSVLGKILSLPLWFGDFEGQISLSDFVLSIRLYICIHVYSRLIYGVIFILSEHSFLRFSLFPPIPSITLDSYIILLTQISAYTCVRVYKSAWIWQSGEKLAVTTWFRKRFFGPMEAARSSFVSTSTGMFLSLSLCVCVYTYICVFVCMCKGFGIW